MSSVMEEALAMLAPTGPEFAGGLSNHGPMAVDAMIALGRADAVLPWLEDYVVRLEAAPPGRAPIVGARWQEGLGDFARFADWHAFFGAALRQHGWEAVLEDWVVRLVPGLVGAALHGLLRTAHAVRSLQSSKSELGLSGMRLDELARGLAYWAARYQPLPQVDTPPAGEPHKSVEAALAEVPVVAIDRPNRPWLIFDRVRMLDASPEFARAAYLVDTSGDPSAFIGQLTRAFARVYLENADHDGIAFIHCVTGPSALRFLLPFVDDPLAARAALRHAWHACAAIYATHHIARPSPRELTVAGPTALASAAVASGDEHAIKFTEACLREHALAPDVVFLTAAADASRRYGAKQ